MFVGSGPGNKEYPAEYNIDKTNRELLGSSGNLQPAASKKRAYGRQKIFVKSRITFPVNISHIQKLEGKGVFDEFCFLKKA